MVILAAELITWEVLVFVKKQEVFCCSERNPRKEGEQEMHLIHTKFNTRKLH